MSIFEKEHIFEYQYYSIYSNIMEISFYTKRKIFIKYTG